jgi:hypothetical protein
MACCLHFTGIPLRPGSGSGSDNADRFASISSPGVDNGELSCSCQDDMILAVSSTRYQWRTGWSFRVKRSKAASPSESPRTKLLTSTCADPRLPFLHHHSTITSDIVSHKLTLIGSILTRCIADYVCCFSENKMTSRYN